MDTRRNPFEEMERMFEQMRRSTMARPFGTGLRFDEDRMDEFGMDDAPFAFGSRGAFRTGEGANLTVETGEDAHVVLADLPGFETEEIDLRFDDGRLSIVAESRVDEEHEGIRSRRNRSIREGVRVPGDVMADGIEATYRNGVLEVRLPFEGDAGSGRRIDID